MLYLRVKNKIVKKKKKEKRREMETNQLKDEEN